MAASDDDPEWLPDTDTATIAAQALQREWARDAAGAAAAKAPPAGPPQVGTDPKLTAIMDGQSAANITSFADYDVVGGRGQGIQSLAGNVFYRELIVANTEAYDAGNQKAKSAVATSIVHTVLARRGRFFKNVRKAGDPAVYQVMGYDAAVVKVAQALRDNKKASSTASEPVPAGYWRPTASGRPRPPPGARRYKTNPPDTASPSKVSPVDPSGISMYSPGGDGTRKRSAAERRDLSAKKKKEEAKKRKISDQAAAKPLRDAAYEALEVAYTAALAQVQRSRANLSVAEQHSEAAKLVQPSQLSSDTPLLKEVWKKWKTATDSNVGYGRWKADNPISYVQRSRWSARARKRLGWGIIEEAKTTRSLGDATAETEFAQAGPANENFSWPHATEYLKAWAMEHAANPYPSEQEKDKIMAETGIKPKQLKDWFGNYRQRFWKKPARETTGETPEAAGAKANSTDGGRKEQSTDAEALKGGKSDAPLEPESSEPVDAAPWTCQCGEELPATRTRCGECKRWRGGKVPRGTQHWSTPKEDGEEGKAEKSDASSSKGDTKAGEANALSGLLGAYASSDEEEDEALSEETEPLGAGDAVQENEELQGAARGRTPSGARPDEEDADDFGGDGHEVDFGDPNEGGGAFAGGARDDDPEALSEEPLGAGDAVEENEALQGMKSVGAEENASENLSSDGDFGVHNRSGAKEDTGDNEEVAALPWRMYADKEGAYFDNGAMTTRHLPPELDESGTCFCVTGLDGDDESVFFAPNADEFSYSYLRHKIEEVIGDAAIFSFLLFGRRVAEEHANALKHGVKGDGTAENPYVVCIKVRNATPDLVAAPAVGATGGEATGGEAKEAAAAASVAKPVANASNPASVFQSDPASALVALQQQSQQGLHGLQQFPLQQGLSGGLGMLGGGQHLQQLAVEHQQLAVALAQQQQQQLATALAQQQQQQQLMAQGIGSGYLSAGINNPFGALLGLGTIGTGTSLGGFGGANLALGAVGADISGVNNAGRANEVAGNPGQRGSGGAPGSSGGAAQGGH